jgi:hypothetical protein
MRDWNPNWRDIVAPRHVLTMRTMVMASINWIECYPLARPTWREAAPTVNDAELCATLWSNVFEPTNDDARRWFQTIALAAERQPSCLLMAKAIAAGIMVYRHGWHGFDREMRQR